MITIELQQIRKIRGYSQSQLAEAIGHTVHSIKRIENQRCKAIPLDTLNAICNFLKCDVSDILVYIPDKE